MSDIRINALATTATASASDDYIAIDGSANGTRKLNAYSPTFGGNLTVSGTGTSSVAGKLTLGGPTLTGILSVRPVANGVLNVRNAGEISAYSGAAIDMLNDAVDALTDFTVRAANYNFLSTGPVKVLSTTASSSTTTGALTVAGGAGVAGAIYAGGNLTVSGTGTSSVAGVMSAGSGQFTSSLGAASGAGAEIGYFSGGGYVFGYNRGTSSTLPLYLQHPGGNVLIGTTTDGGQKLQVNGTGYLSDSLRVGTSFTPTAWGVKAIEVNDAGGGLFATYYGGSPKGYMLGLSNGLRFNGHSSSSRIDIMDAGSIILATNNTTALTLDSSQRCILAGALRLNNAYTAGAPTATGYVTLQDSAGNTYKVLVGT